MSISIYSQVSTFGNFPYEESCLNGKPSDITFPIPQGGRQNRAAFPTNPNIGLRLTPAEQSSFGAAFINNRQFGSDNGIIIEFEYMIYGGSGGDGLCMFLFDASVTNPQIGSHGAAIGYSYNQVIYPYFKNDLKLYQGGLSGAYMGVALDVYGNYKTLRFQRNELMGGIPYKDRFKSMPDAKESKYDTGNQVTIRGAKGLAKDTSIYVAYPQIYPGPGMPTEPWMAERKGNTTVGLDGFTGYPVLITQSTNASHGFALNNQGKYIQLTDYTGNKFTISGGNNEYRKAIIELFPVEEGKAGGGFYVTVKIQHGNKTDVIINDYQYKESIPYYENGMVPFPYNSDEPRDNPPIRTLNATIPASLRIGFAASTGESTNNHVLKNIKVSLPRAAEANNDTVSTYINAPVSIDVLANDLAYNGVISRVQTGNRNNIDPGSFRFLNSDTVKFNSADTYIQYPVSQGVWKYDLSTEKVTFTPAAGFKGEVSIKYDIKGKRDSTPKAGPYHDEAYRSLTATIVVKVIDNPNPGRNTVTNKMVTNLSN